VRGCLLSLDLSPTERWNLSSRGREEEETVVERRRCSGEAKGRGQRGRGEGAKIDGLELDRIDARGRRRRGEGPMSRGLRGRGSCRSESRYRLVRPGNPSQDRYLLQDPDVPTFLFLPVRTNRRAGRRTVGGGRGLADRAGQDTGRARDTGPVVSFRFGGVTVTATLSFQVPFHLHEFVTSLPIGYA
jgi:hypothetical protein